MVEPGQPPVEPQPGDADIIWRFDMLNKLPVFPHDAASCSPLVYGDCVYVCTANGVGTRGKRRDAAVAQPHRAGQARRPAGGPRQRKDRLAGVPRPVVVALAGRGRRASRLVFFGGGDGVCYAFDAITPAAASRGFLH